MCMKTGSTTLVIVLHNKTLKTENHKTTNHEAALLLQQQHFNRTMQRLQQHQQVFEESLKVMKIAHANIQRHIQNQVQRENLFLSGHKILYETQDAFYVQNSQGITIEIPK